MKYKVGYGKRCITPELGTILAGYDYPRIAESIHDDLYVRVITFRGDKIYVLIQLDLVGIDYYFIDIIKEELNKVGVEENNIFVITSHTHSGPSGTVNTNKGYQKGLKQVFGEYNENYVLRIVSKIKESVIDGFENEDFASIEVYRKHIDGVCSNRNNKEWAYDNELIKIEIIRKDDKKILLYNLPCHPTVMNHLNMSVTADFPYIVEEELNEYSFIMFINGSCGDISTRFTREEASFAEMKLIGKKVANNIRANNISVYKNKIEKLNSKDLEVSLKLKSFETEEQALQKVEDAKSRLEDAKKENRNITELRVLESMVEGATNNYKLIKGFTNVKEINAKIKIFEINDIKLIFIPGEVFSSLGIKIKEVDKVNNIVCGYGNGYIGYIPDKEAYKKKCYESFSSPFECGQGEKLVDEIIRII